MAVAGWWLGLLTPEMVHWLLAVSAASAGTQRDGLCAGRGTYSRSKMTAMP